MPVVRLSSSADSPAMQYFFSLLRQNVLTSRRGGIRELAAPDDRHLNRTHLPPRGVAEALPERPP